MVEVGGIKEGFRVSWYAAVIVDLIPDSEDKFLVEYQTVKTLNGTVLLKDKVDASNIRPCPPETPQIGHFKKFQEVDAWYKDGWWVSDIVKVLDDYNYRVYVRSTDEEITLEHSNLRPHQDWIDGEWVTASRVGHLCPLNFCVIFAVLVSLLRLIQHLCLVSLDAILSILHLTLKNTFP